VLDRDRKNTKENLQKHSVRTKTENYAVNGSCNPLVTGYLEMPADRRGAIAGPPPFEERDLFRAENGTWHGLSEFELELGEAGIGERRLGQGKTVATQKVKPDHLSNLQTHTIQLRSSPKKL
jgi:hypothetical protein